MCEGRACLTLASRVDVAWTSGTPVTGLPSRPTQGAGVRNLTFHFISPAGRDHLLGVREKVRWLAHRRLQGRATRPSQAVPPRRRRPTAGADCCGTPRVGSSRVVKAGTSRDAPDEPASAVQEVEWRIASGAAAGDSSTSQILTLTSSALEVTTMPYVTNEGIRIHCEVDGDGPPLVLQHGFTQKVKSWELAGYVDALKPYYRLIRVGARGHGDSDKPHAPTAYTLPKHVTDVVAVLDVLNLRTGHFWGYSRGVDRLWHGEVCASACRRAPDRRCAAVRA
jgi:alpha/beta hydrolase fold